MHATAPITHSDVLIISSPPLEPKAWSTVQLTFASEQDVAKALREHLERARNVHVQALVTIQPSMRCDGSVVPTFLVQRELMKCLEEVYLREDRGAVDLRDDFLNRFTRKSDPSDRFVERLGVTREPNL